MQTDYITLFTISQLGAGLSYTSYKAYKIYQDIQLQFKYPNYKKTNKRVNQLLPLNIGYKTIIDNDGNYKETNELILEDLTKAPHLLIGGATGSGKGYTISKLIKSLQTTNELVEILICDLKGLDFIEFENDYTKIADTLDSILEHMENFINRAYARKELFKKHRVKNLIEYNRLTSTVKEPYLILVVDELAELLLTYKGDENSKIKSKLNNLITSVTQFGRAFGIHAILSTQYPKVQVVNGLIKANCSYKIGLRMESEINTRVIGLKSPCHNIKTQYGYAYFKSYKGETFVKI